MTNQTAKKAVIYCRVSSIKQTTEGDGLSSQETRCREYIKHKGYTVDAVFKDDLTGDVINRPGMQEMLKYVKRHRHDPRIIIIDDITRLARNIDTHLRLRRAIAEAGATLESPSIEFGEDSDSILVENLLASVSQHQRQKNSEQTRNRMWARMLNGYWVFRPPIGYRYERVSGQGKILVRDEPFASIIQEALEGFASGRFQIQAEVKRFLERFPEYPRDLNGEVRIQRVTEILSRVVYAGYVEFREWKVNLRPAQHEGLISFETFQKIQGRLQEKARAPVRKDLNEDFPLRGFITCCDCNYPLTSCWSKGRHKRYPYYLCHNRGCDSYGKSIPRDRLENEFEALLRKLKPTEGLFKLAKAMFTDLWNHRLNNTAALAQSAKKELAKIERQTQQLLDRIVEATSPAVISAYEQRITDLEKSRIEIQEKLAKNAKPRHAFEEMFEPALVFLANPCKLWAFGEFELKRTVLKLAFSDRLAYCRNHGLRTADLAFPFKVLEGFSNPKNRMVPRAGLEPATFRLGGEKRKI